MTKDEINQALRMVAMGRVNHPSVDQLAGELAAITPTLLPDPPIAKPDSDTLSPRESDSRSIPSGEDDRHGAVAVPARAGKRRR